MGYDRGDTFSFDFDLNETSFGSKLKGKLSPRSYPIQCERKWNTSFLSVPDTRLVQTLKSAGDPRHLKTGTQENNKYHDDFRYNGGSTKTSP